jgi:hypothetical protein
MLVARAVVCTRLAARLRAGAPTYGKARRRADGRAAPLKCAALADVEAAAHDPTLDTGMLETGMQLCEWV